MDRINSKKDICSDIYISIDTVVRLIRNHQYGSILSDFDIAVGGA